MTVSRSKSLSRTSITFLSEITHDFEILIAEDGSTDDSAELVTDYKKQEPRVSNSFTVIKDKGRGRALNRAIHEARGSIVCYYDVDLATDMHHLQELIGAIREGYDISTGSRLLPESNIVRSEGREIASRSYNFPGTHDAWQPGF